MGISGLDSYAAAIRFYFLMGQKYVALLFDNLAVLYTRRGLARENTIHYADDEEGASRGGGRKLPTCFEMIEWLWEVWYPAGPTLDRFMAALGNTLQFHFLWRVSQLVWTLLHNHALMADEVMVEFRCGSILFSYEIQASSRVFEDVVAFILHEDSSKTHQPGTKKGNDSRNVVLESCGNRDTFLMEKLFYWCQWSGIREGDPFFSRYQLGAGSHKKVLGHRKMQRCDIADSLKAAANAIGFDATRFSTQSNRRGGATLMHANRIPDVEILELAKWSKRSDVPFRYNSNTGRSGGALSNLSTADPAFSAADLRRMAGPAVKRGGSAGGGAI